MNEPVVDLADRLHEFYKQLMATEPWQPGYAEAATIHEYLLKVVRDNAQKDIDGFKSNLKEAVKEVETSWTSSASALSQWADKLKPVLKKVEEIIGTAVPLLALLL
jgi:phage-related protein